VEKGEAAPAVLGGPIVQRQVSKSLGGGLSSLPPSAFPVRSLGRPLSVGREARGTSSTASSSCGSRKERTFVQAYVEEKPSSSQPSENDETKTFSQGNVLPFQAGCGVAGD